MIITNNIKYKLSDFIVSLTTKRDIESMIKTLTHDLKNNENIPVDGINPNSAKNQLFKVFDSSDNNQIYYFENITFTYIDPIYESIMFKGKLKKEYTEIREDIYETNKDKFSKQIIDVFITNYKNDNIIFRIVNAQPIGFFLIYDDN